MSRAWDIVLDNPILTKYVRTRLRTRQVAPWAAVVVVLCLGALWASQAWDLAVTGDGVSFLLELQVVVLVFFGAFQVGGAVGGVRESGIIDFHRVSPLPPSWLAVGFFLGAPIREYLLAGLILPFSFLLGAMGPQGVEGWFLLTIAILSTAWVFHALAMVSSLLSSKPRGLGKGASVGIFIVGWFIGQPILGGAWFAFRYASSAETIQFFGVELHWLAFLLLYQAAAIGFLFRAATRRFRADRMHAFSKLQAVACMATFSALILGAAGNFEGQSYMILVALYLLVFEALILAVTITPNQTEYVRGERRALRRGDRRPSPLEDEGINRPAVFALCALVFLGAMGSWLWIERNPSASYSQTIAAAVFVVAYFGLSLQYFLIRLPKSSSAIMAVFLFLVWLLPVMIGSISFGVGTNRQLYLAVLSLSPITGLAMSSGVIEEVGDAQIYRLLVLLPAITFAFTFNYLTVATQRRIDRTVRQAVEKKRGAGPFQAKSPDADLVV